MKNLGLLRFCAFIALACVVVISACSGGGSTPIVTPPTTYTVTANAGTGTTMTPASATVDAGGTATFTVALKSGYKSLAVTGCTLSGSTCTTGPVNSNMTVSTSATLIPTHVLTATADRGLAVSPATITVTDGQTATFTISVVSGYAISSVSASGVSGTLTGTTYTTAPVTSDGSIHVLGGTANGVYALNWLKITPNVLFDDEFSTAPVSVTASTYGTIDHMAVCYLTATFDKNIPSTYKCIPMLDAGMSGGEHLYSLNFTTGVVPALRFYGGTIDSLQLSVSAYDSSGNELSSGNGREFGSGIGMNNQLGLGVVSRKLAVNTLQVASNVFSTPNMVNIVLPWSEDGTVTQVLYKYYPDVFRAVILQQIGHTNGGNIPTGGPWQINTSGLGLTPYPQATKLEAFVTETPSDITEVGFLHEVGHSVSNYLSSKDAPLGNSGAHTAMSTNNPGQMSEYGAVLVPTTGGYVLGGSSNITVSPFCIPYSPLELYLLGLGPLSAVPAAGYLNPSYNGPWNVTIPSSEVKQISGADIVNVYGERSPSFTNSNKDYPTVFIGLSEEPMTPAEVALMNRLAVYFASKEVDSKVNNQGVLPVCSVPSFSVATLGVGTMESTVPNTK